MTISVKMRRVLFRGGIAVAVALVLGALVYALIELGAASRQIAQQRKVEQALVVGLSGAQDQLKQHGVQPSQPPPAQIIAQAGPPGAVGPQGPGPSDAQVQAAVAAYLAAHPIAGQPPTQEQVAAVVAVYMTQHPPAAGPVGSPGPTGAPGPGPSDDQIASAVAAWEQTHPAPSGPPGPPGPSGASGAPGVGQTGPQGPPGPSGESGASGAPGSPGPACPTGYQPTSEKINGHDAVVCEQAPASPPPSTASSAAPAARQTGIANGGASQPTRTWPVLLLSAVLVWPPEKRSLFL